MIESTARRLRLLASSVALTGLCFAQPQAPAGGQSLCVEECPLGSRLVNFNTRESVFATSRDVNGGFFHYDSESCETYCEPVTSCPIPNVPRSSERGLECVLLPGFAAAPDPAEVDTSWGQYWDEALATP